LRFVKISVLKRSNLYSIAFKSLKDGVHHFRFEINKLFFEALDYSEITEGTAIVEAVLERRLDTMVLKTIIKGQVLVSCDRCMDDFFHPVDIENSLIVKPVKYREEFEDDNQDVMYVDESDDYLDLHHYLYESIILGLPLQRFHPVSKNGKSQCNKEMLKRLGNIGHSDEAQEQTETIWEKLKEINNNKK
jgi:uncharacterized protein